MFTPNEHGDELDLENSVETKQMPRVTSLSGISKGGLLQTSREELPRKVEKN